jgi:hypothetical protein
MSIHTATENPSVMPVQRGAPIAWGRSACPAMAGWSRCWSRRRAAGPCWSPTPGPDLRGGGRCCLGDAAGRGRAGVSFDRRSIRASLRWKSALTAETTGTNARSGTIWPWDGRRTRWPPRSKAMAAPAQTRSLFSLVAMESARVDAPFCTFFGARDAVARSPELSSQA